MEVYKEAKILEEVENTQWKIEPWEFDTTVPHWVLQQPPEMPCKDVLQGTVSGSEDSTGWPSAGHFDFSQQATFGETSTIFGDMIKVPLTNQKI